MLAEAEGYSAAQLCLVRVVSVAKAEEDGLNTVLQMLLSEPLEEQLPFLCLLKFSVLLFHGTRPLRKHT